MSEWKHDMLVENIRVLLKRHDMTQQQLAEITGMTQANVSRALNPNDKRHFTLEQVICISQHFGVPIDELVGNKVPQDAATSPRAVLAFLSALLCSANVRATLVTKEELIYDQYINDQGYPDCTRVKKEIEYPAFYFPDYMRVRDYAFCESEYDEVDMDFCMGGNETKFLRMNEILKKFIPMTKLYRSKEIPEEAFQMILAGYLDQLPDK